MAQETQQVVQLAQRQGLMYHIRKRPLVYAMLIPGLLYLILLKYLPMYGVTVAFQQFNLARGYFGSRWVGLENFTRFLNDPFLYRIVRNTLIISFLTLVFGFPAPIILAIMLNEVASNKFKRTVQTISYLPHFISVVVVVGLMKSFLSHDGLVNEFFEILGLGAQRFFIDPPWFRPIYVASDIWQGMGWGSILYLAALTGVSEELYEAAFMDGANRWQRVWHITLPGLQATIIILLIFRLGSLMSVGFEKVYLMYSETTYEVADVIRTYVFRRGIEQLQISYAAAVGFFESVINCILIVGANMLARRFSETSLW